MVVDQPRNIGALPVAVARECGVDIAYLPGLRMRRSADLYPGRSKTDARDAFVIADAARTLPDTLLRIDEQNDVVEGLRLLAGFDADLASEENRRGQPNTIGPSLRSSRPGTHNRSENASTCRPWTTRGVRRARRFHRRNTASLGRECPSFRTSVVEEDHR